jgi:TPR repeat protein
MSRGSSSQAGTASGLNFDSVRQLADTGNAEAQYDYGRRLLSGEGISIDMRSAAYYLKLAADQGDAQARYNCGNYLQNGEGVSISMRSAAYYFKLAADQGYAEAQSNYGNCLHRPARRAGSISGSCASTDDASRVNTGSVAFVLSLLIDVFARCANLLSRLPTAGGTYFWIQKHARLQ